MKAVSKLVLLIVAGLFPALAAFASTPEQAYVGSYRKMPPGVPVPVSVVTPAVGYQYNGATVRLEFVVDAQGRPTDFRVASAPDDVVASAVLKAVRQWRFAPGQVDGKPVATKVALPVRIVDSVYPGFSYAANE